MGSRRTGPPAGLSRKQHAAVGGRRRRRGVGGGRLQTLAADTLRLIQHDLLIYFRSSDDVNGSILTAACAEIRWNINASGRRGAAPRRTLKWTCLRVCVWVCVCVIL